MFNLKYLVDYENTDVSGLLGLQDLTEEDKVVIFYSEKSKRVDFSIVSILTSMKADFELVGGQKSAPNYMDFWIVCECAKTFFKEGIEDIAIISKDKGYISVQDYFKRMNKDIILSMDIDSVIKRNKKKNIVKPVDTVNVPKENISSVNKSNNKNKKNKQKDNVQVLSQKSYYKKMSVDQMNELRLLIEDVSTGDDFNQKVFTAVEKNQKPGMLHFSLVESLGRKDGEKVFRMIEEKFFTRVNDLSKEA